MVSGAGKSLHCAVDLNLLLIQDVMITSPHSVSGLIFWVQINILLHKETSELDKGYMFRFESP